MLGYKRLCAIRRKKTQEKGKPKAAAKRKTAEVKARPDRGAQRPQRGTKRQAARPNAPKIVYHLEKRFGAKAENEGIPLDVAASLLKRLDNNKDGKLTRKELFHY